jgi:shikimate dehydrogenase
MTPLPGFLQLGLAGFPVEHSLSPRLHAAALRSTGLHGDYRLYPVPPLPEGENALRALLDRLQTGEIHGLNVTIPHKRAVISMLDELSPAAGAIGAANTLLIRDGRLAGDNTDAAGFWRDFCSLLESAGRVSLPGKALVLGAGGAARAAAYALADGGWQVVVAARDPLQAAQLTADMSVLGLPGQFTVIPFNRASLAAHSDASALINATPLGMQPAIETYPWPFDLALPPGAVVYDLVYRPVATRLVNMAWTSGLPARGGLGMLVEQAMLSFQLWSGQQPARSVLLDALTDSKQGAIL